MLPSVSAPVTGTVTENELACNNEIRWKLLRWPDTANQVRNILIFTMPGRLAAV